MTEDELVKEAKDYLRGQTQLNGGGFFHCNILNLILGFAEPREKQIAELEQKYQELVDKLHHCWNCKKSFDKSCSFGKMLEAEKKKCKDWESTFGISN